MAQSVLFHENDSSLQKTFKNEEKSDIVESSVLCALKQKSK